MTKDEALKLALEALEALHDENMDYLTRNKLGGENNQCMVFAREAITAIKEALAQPERQPLTDEQIDTVFTTHSPQAGVDFYIRCRIFARAIEAAHNI